MLQPSLEDYTEAAIGTCSVCLTTVRLSAEGCPEWHEFEDSLAPHPTIHRGNHCMGVCFPPLEVSIAGASHYLNTVRSLWSGIIEGCLELANNKAERLFDDEISDYRFKGHEGFEVLRRRIHRKEVAQLRRLERIIGLLERRVASGID